MAGIRGISIDYARELLRSKPKGAKHINPLHKWNKLTNHGNGSAFNTRVTIITKSVLKAGEWFNIDEEKLIEFPYSPALNSIPSSPSDLKSGDSGEFFRLPTPIVTDFLGQLSEMECVCIIDYEDLYSNKYKTYQQLRVFNRNRNEKNNTAEVLLTFSDEILDYNPQPH